MIVVKLGGSVMKNWENIVKVLKEVNALTGKKILLVPGGGKIANHIREIEVGDDEAHWMAVGAMEINGYYLSSFGLQKIFSRNFEDIKFDGVAVLMPYLLIKENDALPHTWDVTSDSIALWIAGEMRAEYVIKVTDVDGVFKNSELLKKTRADEIGFESCIDSYALKLIQEYRITMFVCNGLVPERVKDYILRGEALGTLITAGR
jgi:hypothetical protein